MDDVNGQDFHSEIWIRKDGSLIPVSEMTLKEILQAIWALYILVIRFPNWSWIIKEKLYSSLMGRMRDFITGMPND